MTEKEYIDKIKSHNKAFDDIWEAIVRDTNAFVGEDNKHIYHHESERTIEILIDNLCLSSAWISDKLNGYSGTPGSHSYKASLTKKIRKALGYNL